MYDDEDKITVENKPTNQNTAHLKYRRIQQNPLERQSDQKLETTDRPIISGPNSKFNKYLPKLSTQTYKSSAAHSDSKTKHDKNHGPTGVTDEDYAELTYDDYDDYSHETLIQKTKQYNAKPLLITDKPPINGREKGFYTRNVNRQN